MATVERRHREAALAACMPLAEHYARQAPPPPPKHVRDTLEQVARALADAEQSERAVIAKYLRGPDRQETAPFVLADLVELQHARVSQ